MIQKIKAGYFNDKNYVLIYIHHLLVNIAHAGMYVFTGAYFLKQGMPLPFVLLFYGLEFGLRGFLCPIGLAVFNRLGVLKSLNLSVVFQILFFIGVALSEYNLWLGFVSFILMAIRGAIYYPFTDVLEAIYIKDDHNRTKQLSFGLVAGSMGRIIGASGIAFILSYTGFGYVVAFITLSLICANLPFIWMAEQKMTLPAFKPKTAFRFLASPDFKPLWPLFFGEQLYIIVRTVMVPVFIYSVVGDIEMLGYLIALSLIIEQALTLIFGHFTDKLGVMKAMNAISVSYPLSMLGYAFFAKTPLSIFFVESFHKINSNAFASTFNAALHDYGRKHFKNKLLLYGAAWQMSLCFGELIILPIYALLAYFIGIHVFYVACFGAVAGIWLIRQYMQHNIQTGT